MDLRRISAPDPGRTDQKEQQEEEMVFNNSLTTESSGCVYFRPPAPLRVRGWRQQSLEVLAGDDLQGSDAVSTDGDKENKVRRNK